MFENHREYSKIIGKSAYQRVVQIATHPRDFATELFEVFAHLVGKPLEGKVVKLKRTPHQGQSLYQATETINSCIKKGDIFYLDGFHKNHLEFFSRSQKAKWVLNLDGTINQAKTAIAVAEGRTI